MSRKSACRLLVLLIAALALSGFTQKAMRNRYWQCQMQVDGRLAGDVLIYDSGSILSLYATSQIETKFGTISRGRSLNLQYVANTMEPNDRYHYGDASSMFTSSGPVIYQAEIRLLKTAHSDAAPRSLQVALETPEKPILTVVFEAVLTCDEYGK
jgi:hypothetical protein